jgi:hypothetical protein
LGVTWEKYCSSKMAASVTVQKRGETCPMIVDAWPPVGS